MSVRSFRNPMHIFQRNHSRATRPAVVGMASAALCFAMLATGCAPEVGSDAWCTQLKETPKADWSANDAVDFTKHCLLK